MSEVARRKSGESGRGDCWVPPSPPSCRPDRLAVRTAEEHILWILACSLGNQGIEIKTSVVSGGGTEIAYWTSGVGPPLVLVHGAPADHNRWRPLLP